MKQGLRSGIMPVGATRQPRANRAFVPLLLVKNGRVIVKMIPYTALQQAMSKIRQSKCRPAVGRSAITSNHQECEKASTLNSCFPVDCGEAVAVRNSADLGFVISEVRSISKDDFDALRIKRQPVGESSDIPEDEDLSRTVSEISCRAAPSSVHEHRIKIKLARRDTNTFGRPSWRVVDMSLNTCLSPETEEIRSSLSGRTEHQQTDMEEKPDIQQITDRPRSCADGNQRDKELSVDRKRRSQEDLEDDCARSRPFQPTVKPSEIDSASCPGSSSEYDARQDRNHWPVRSSTPCEAATQTPAASVSLNNCLNSKDKHASDFETNAQWRPVQPTFSASSRNKSADSIGDYDSGTDSTPSTPSSWIASKRRRLSASSSGDFHQPTVTTPLEDASDEDDSSSVCSELLPCPWLHGTPETKPSTTDSNETTPSRSWVRSLEILQSPPVFCTPRDERIYNLKRQLAERFIALNDLKSGSGDTAGKF